MTTIQEAIAACEAAEQGSAKLDFIVGKALDSIPMEAKLGKKLDLMGYARHSHGVVPPYTTSLDATETLPDGWEWKWMVYGGGCNGKTETWRVGAHLNGSPFHRKEGSHKSLPIARTITLLRIKEM